MKDIPTELQDFTKSLKNEIQRTIQEFQNLLPKGKVKDELVQALRNTEISRINSYLVKSFSTFTNPNYVPDENILKKAVD